MPDFATSTDTAVQRQLDRLFALGPGADILGLERITQLLGRLGNPQDALPPVLHVAGTNGKGSTCAFLRTGLEASGKRVHVYASPHLVRFNERIRLAGQLIDDAELGPLLEEVLDKGGDIGGSFFEVTTAAAFLAFARTPADACVIEVGLGGRLDATNVLSRPAVTGIAQLGIDHERFLGSSAEGIAAEKAGIAKPGVPLVTMAYAPASMARVEEAAAAAGAPLKAFGRDWRLDRDGDGFRYADAEGELALPAPVMAGPHQPGNLGLAVAMLRHGGFAPSPAAVMASARETRWPARMQRLRPGPLTARVPGAAVWLDGGHNAAAAEALAASLRQVAGDRVALVTGILANKDAAGLLGPLAPFADRLIAVPVPGHDHHDPAALAAAARDLGLAAAAAPDLPAAFELLTGAPPDTILILGSLYLAGQALALNDEAPD